FASGFIPATCRWCTSSRSEARAWTSTHRAEALCSLPESVMQSFRSLFALGLVCLASPVRAADYDIVVYGGTSAGVAAAIQAARMGKTVVLIEPSRHIGGLTSGGLGFTDSGN